MAWLSVCSEVDLHMAHAEHAADNRQIWRKCEWICISHESVNFINLVVKETMQDWCINVNSKCLATSKQLVQCHRLMSSKMWTASGIQIWSRGYTELDTQVTEWPVTGQRTCLFSSRNDRFILRQSSLNHHGDDGQRWQVCVVTVTCWSSSSAMVVWYSCMRASPLRYSSDWSVHKTDDRYRRLPDGHDTAPQWGRCIEWGWTM